MILDTCPVSDLPHSIHKPCQNFSGAIDISMFQPGIVTGLVIQLENGILFLVGLLMHSIRCTKNNLNSLQCYELSQLKSLHNNDSTGIYI